VEAEGIRRAKARLSEAEIVLLLVEHEAVLPDLQMLWQEQVVSHTAMPRPQGMPIVIGIATKADLQPDTRVRGDWLAVSIVTGKGLEALRNRLESEVQRLTNSQGQVPLTRARHRAALQETLARLTSAGSAAAECRAEDIRLALRSLGRVTGRVGAEEILGQIFSQFCIGK
jgi:tRNA modification GTPase